MQALYQLSYSPLLCPPASPPGGDANITRSTGWNTKSFPTRRDGPSQAVTNE